MTPRRKTGLGLDVVERVIRNATSQRHDVAIEDDQLRLTWGELGGAVSAAAGSLHAAGVNPGDRVVLRLPNSATFVVAALGCLWLGASFVPISVEDPPERAATIVAACRPAAVVDSEPGEWLDGYRHLLPDDLRSGRHRGVRPCHVPSRDAYVIFTSGTTGQPKGVRISMEALAWAVSVTAHRFGLGSATRSLSVSSFNFDGSYATLFTTLWAGGSLVIPPRAQLLYGKRFFRALLEQGITHTSFSPTYLRLLLRSARFADLADSGLRTIALGGEELTVADLRGLWGVMPDLRIFNIYGPTETTIQVTSFEVPKRFLQSEKVPIGRPHDGVEFYLVDGAVPVAGGLGELHIGGRQLMSGYLGDKGLTDQVIRHDVVPGRPVYKTGDLVERDEEGWYYYRGRADDVVKRRGVRVSLHEVSRALASIPEVEAAVCLPIDHEGSVVITAVIQTALETPLPILRAARSHLPEAMMPDDVHLVRELPLNSSGKVDRSALSRLEWPRR